ncbi:EFR1 family ferrodoxin [Clostridium vincentii]|uniref:Ferredoxin n=1 Tax=Clostridium vincentii TaxID=52704 RepID=A0A2T0BE87_9CLOT|nr:EFR1 family ferrodoxin [Clostridium vincentii]PRR82174.1 NADH-plastoquinone oxidoreductase subunit [Clostridium vincentii]
MIISKNTIFYFSGTGNSLKISKDIALQIEDVELISIPKIMNNKEIKIQSKSIGIIFPVYMCGLPLIVENFIKKLNINKSTYVFAVANYGGMPGNALKQVNDLIEDRYAKLNSGFIINMPGNYIVLYGAKSKEDQIKAFEKEKIKVQEIAKIIKEKKDCEYEKSKIIIDRVLGPLFYKRIYKIHTKDKLFLAKDNCNGCGVCKKVCGVKNIEIKNGKPIWKNNCEQCMACIQYCPQEAIEYDKKTIGRKRYKNPNVSLQEMINGVQNK